MKNQTIGVEIEMTGITKAEAAEVAVNFLGGRITRAYDGYDTYKIIAPDQRVWKIMNDASINTMKNTKGKLKAINNKDYSVELVTPILGYDDIETLQELIRRLRKAGAVSDSELQCGIHVHIGTKDHTPNTLKNLVNLMAAKEDLIQAINKKKPKTLEQLANIWYSGYGFENRDRHYHTSRYHGLNLHSTFTKGTIEFRLFNGTLHAGKIRSYIVFCLAISHQALTQKNASAKRTNTDNEKYTFRCWLLRLGLIGD